MSLLTGILSAALSIVSANGVNAELPSMDRGILNHALHCSGDEMNTSLDDCWGHYLESFNEAEIHISNNGSFFKGSMTVRDLFTYNGVENIDAPGYNVEFDATYLAGLDVCVIDMTLVKNGIDSMKETAIVLPFDDDNGNRDAEIVINGFKYYRSELLQGSTARINSGFSPQEAHEYSGIFLELEGWLPALSHNVNDPTPLDEPCGGGVVFAVIGIADAISGVDRVVGFGHQYLDIPLLSITTFSDWLFFEAKMSNMKSNFEHNVNAELPIQKNNASGVVDRFGKHYIYWQGDYSDWKFSFFGNLSNQGCGVIAAYNMLIDCNRGQYVDLPTLIALFEALNADALFGCFGVNMVPDGYISTLSSYLNEVALKLALNCVAAVTAVFRVLADSARNIFEAMAWDLLGIIAVTNTAATALVIVDLVFASTVVLVHYFSHYKHDVAFVIERYIGSSYTHKSTNYNGFSSQIVSGNQTIVCFWNKIYDENLGLVNYLAGAHFVYISTGLSDGYYYCYNFNEEGDMFPTFLICETIGAFSLTEASIKMISSYSFYI